MALLSPIPFFLAVVGLNTLFGAPAPTAAQWATWPSLMVAGADQVRFYLLMLALAALLAAVIIILGRVYGDERLR